MDSIIKDFKKKFACSVSLGEVLGQKDKPEIVIQVCIYTHVVYVMHMYEYMLYRLCIRTYSICYVYYI